MRQKAVDTNDAELLRTVIKIETAKEDGTLSYMQVSQKIDSNGDVAPDVLFSKFENDQMEVKRHELVNPNMASMMKKNSILGSIAVAAQCLNEILGNWVASLEPISKMLRLELRPVRQH